MNIWFDDVFRLCVWSRSLHWMLSCTYCLGTRGNVSTVRRVTPSAGYIVYMQLHLPVLHLLLGQTRGARNGLWSSRIPRILSAPDGPHVGTMNLAIRVMYCGYDPTRCVHFGAHWLIETPLSCLNIWHDITKNVEMCKQILSFYLNKKLISDCAGE